MDGSMEVRVIYNMVLFDQSNEVEFVLQVIAQFLIVKDLAVELCALVSILHDPWNLNRASPVHIVEALREDQLLQHSLLHLRVGEDHLIVVGYS